MEETIKIIALLPSLEFTSVKNMNNKTYLKEAKIRGTIATIEEFEKLWNKDEIHVSNWFIRVLEVSKDSFRLV